MKSIKSVTRRQWFIAAVATLISAGIAIATTSMCQTCQGSGTSSTPCVLCKGTGLHNQMKCPLCKGRGFQSCAVCGGSGKN